MTRIDYDVLIAIGLFAAACWVSSCRPVVPPPDAGDATPVATGGSYGTVPSVGGAQGTGGSQATGGSLATGGSVCRWAPSRSSRGGIRSPSVPLPRVVGGENAPRGAWPYAASVQASFGGRWYHYCGATLRTPTSLIGAAHCQYQLGDRVLLGTENLLAGGIEREVAGVKNHADWTDTTSGSDVALILLDAPVDIEPPPLVQPGAVLDQSTAWVVGWGAMQEGGDTTTLLQQARVPIWSDEACWWAYPGSIDSTMACLDTLGVGTCQGDSGGGGFVWGTGGWTHTFIVSWGAGCAAALPGVYTNLAAPEIAAWLEACSW